MPAPGAPVRDRKSTRLNSSHVAISYAVFCLKKKKQTRGDPADGAADDAVHHDELLRAVELGQAHRDGLCAERAEEVHQRFFFFFFNDTAPTEIYTLSLHDALPISLAGLPEVTIGETIADGENPEPLPPRSEEHTSELQSRGHLVCRLLLEKKK